MSNNKGNVPAGTQASSADAEALPDTTVENAAGGWMKMQRVRYPDVSADGPGSVTSPATANLLSVGAGDFAATYPASSARSSLGEVPSKVVK